MNIFTQYLQRLPGGDLCYRAVLLIYDLMISLTFIMYARYLRQVPAACDVGHALCVRRSVRGHIPQSPCNYLVVSFPSCIYL